MKFTAPPSLQKVLEAATCLWLVACVTGFAIVSRDWPMVRDAPLVHYVVLLMHHGMEPYRDIVEMNLPACYMIESSVMAVFGAGSAGWRIYDLLLLAISSVSLFFILRPYGRVAVCFAAALFILIHGRDGVLMTGERDLAAACLLLVATAVTFTASRRKFQGGATCGLVLLAGVAAGAAISVKPTLLPLALCLFGWAAWMSSRFGGRKRVFFYAIAGGIISLSASMMFLIEHDALGAFWGELHGLIPYHASLNRASISFLLSHGIAPTLTLFLLWIVAAFLLRKAPIEEERLAILLCAVGGLLSFLLQRKGFWYQRYPLLAFLLPLYAIDFTRLSRMRSLSRLVGIAGLLGGVILATVSLLHLSRYDRNEPPRPLVRDLAEYGSPQQLSGEVQCMDTIGPCIDALYNARIVQSTGFIYDCYLLDGNNSVALDLRRRFWQQMAIHPPRLVVVTDSLCYDDRHSFDKFGRWPEFQDYLDANFTLARESGPLPPVRYWSHPMAAYQYRVYVRR